VTTLLTGRPTHLEADPTAAWIFLGANVVVSVMCITAALIYAYRHRTSLPIWFMVGGALTMLACEPILDHLLLVWYPTNSPWVIAHFFDIGMPAYLLFGYPWYVGLGAFAVCEALQRGVSGRTLWTGYWVVAALDVLIELPSTAAGVHIYYGTQPNLFEHGLSITIPFLMSAVTLLAGYGAHHVMAAVQGWQARIGVLIVIPGASVATLVGTHWPLMLAQNSGASAFVVWATAFVAIGISLAVTWFAITTLPTREVAHGIAHSDDGARELTAAE